MEQLASIIFAQDVPTGGGQMGNLILIVGFIVILYFFMIRPQQKKAKQQKNFVSGLKKNDKVVTYGGIHGKITAIEGDVVELEIARGVKINVELSSISNEASKRYAETK